MVYSESDCIDALHRATDELGEPPTHRGYVELGYSPSVMTITRMFGDWNTAKTAAGIQTNTSSKGVSKEYCVEGLQEAAEMLGESPARAEYASLDVSPSAAAIEEKFGGWNNAKEYAGLETWEFGDHHRSVDVDYFSEINTSRKAYWLGLIYADGSVTERSFSISLQSQDGYLIRKLADDIDSTYIVCESKRGMTCTAVYIDEFIDNLRKQGVTQDKTRAPTMPDLDPSLRPAFIRGIFDGDGSIHIPKKGIKWTIYSINEHRRNILQEWLTQLGVKSVRTSENGVHVTNQYGVRRIWECLYPNGIETGPSMRRKAKRIKTYAQTETRPYQL